MDFVASDHDREIVKSRPGMENGLDECCGEGGIEDCPAFDDGFESDASLDDDNCTESSFGEKCTRRGDLAGDTGSPFIIASEEPGFAEPNQRSAELRLKNHHKGDGDHREHAVIKVGDAFEDIIAQKTDEEGADDQDKEQPFEGTGSTGALDEPENRENDEPDQYDLDSDLPP